MPTTDLEGKVDPPRESYRRELAALLDEDPGNLTDHTHLTEKLGLDSLSMMKVLVWLESKGVTIDTDRSWPATVAEVLSLVESAQNLAVSIRVTNGTETSPASANDPPVPLPETDPLVPVLSGHGLRLVPVTPDDSEFLYLLAASPETGFRWRYRGVPPPVERLLEDMWKQVAIQHVVRRTEDGQRVGHVMAYSVDPTARFAYVGAAFLPSHTGTGLAAHAVALFVRYLFHTLPLAKLYLEVPGYNWPQLRSGEGTLFAVEGVLRDHYFYAGRLWHQYLCAIYRDQLPDGGPR